MLRIPGHDPVRLPPRPLVVAVGRLHILRARPALRVVLEPNSRDAHGIPLVGRAQFPGVAGGGVNRRKATPIKAVVESLTAQGVFLRGRGTIPRTSSWTNRDRTMDVTTSHGCYQCRIRTFAYSERPERFAWYSIPKGAPF